MAKRKRYRSTPVPSSAPPVMTQGGVPKPVADQMIKRGFWFGGIPTLLGFICFPAGYALIQRGVDVPNGSVVLVSMGFLGLGVAGISYGMLSTPWLSSESDNWFGWRSFRTNWRRLWSGLGVEGERIRAEKQATKK